MTNTYWVPIMSQALLQIDTGHNNEYYMTMISIYSIASFKENNMLIKKAVKCYRNIKRTNGEDQLYLREKERHHKVDNTYIEFEKRS